MHPPETITRTRGHADPGVLLRRLSCSRCCCPTDSLFPGGPGNTEKDPARFGRLMDDLERKVFGRLPDSTHVYPGHGKDTTLGAERPEVPGWRARGW